MKSTFFYLFILIPCFLFGQQNQPKVGLVLSGGGAKGFAHVAVLKEIDKAGIQLDYIGVLVWAPLLEACTQLDILQFK